MSFASLAILGASSFLIWINDKEREDVVLEQYWDAPVWTFFMRTAPYAVIAWIVFKEIFKN